MSDDPNGTAGAGLARAESPAPHRLLSNRPFVLLAIADGLASLGRWAFFLAVVGDATYRLDAAPSQVALLLAAFSGSLIVASPLHGLIADRGSAKWLLVVSTAASAPVPLIALGTESLGWLIAASAIYGALYGAIQPCRGALVPRLVPADRLVQANGLIAAALSVQAVVGPALAALLVRALGRDAPYLVTGAAAALSVLLFLLVPDRRRASRDRRSVLWDIGAGFREGWSSPALRRLLGLSVAIWFLVGMLIALEPVYVKDVLQRGQPFLAVIWAVYGAGELVGSTALARLREGSGREPRLVAFGLLLAACGFLLYVSVASPAAVIIGNVVFGMGFPVFLASGQALIQRIADSPGRVSAAFSMTGETGPVVAAILLGAAGAGISVRGWLLGAGIAFGAVALLALRASGRP